MEEPSCKPLEAEEAQEPKPPKPEEKDFAIGNLQGKKRKCDNGGFRSSTYVEIRTMIKDLRPFFLEVLHTPNFKDSKAAHAIRERMNTVIGLTKQLRNETSRTDKPIVPPQQPFTGSALEDQENKHKPAPGANKHNSMRESCDPMLTNMKKMSKQNVEIIAKQKEVLRKEVFSSSFVVGGSPVGWNFLLYPGQKPVYYGVTKESVLARRAAG